MKRIIIDYKKLDQELAAALLTRYPEGYGDDDILSFRNAKGEWIEAVELQTADVLFLVKIGKDLNRLMAGFVNFEEDEDIEIDPAFHDEFDGALEADLEYEED